MKSGDSLQSQLHSLLPQENSNSDSKTIKTSLLKIIHNTVIFDNTVFQIKNICAVELADMTTTYKIPIPKWYWFLLILGIILCFVYGIGIFLLIYVGWLFSRNSKREGKSERYGLRISMNSGETVILTSSNKGFILRIIVTLYNVINSENFEEKITFHFDNFNVEDKSINVGEAYGSSVVSGQVAGDVVNLV
jgi:hypothetical protein